MTEHPIPPTPPDHAPEHHSIIDEIHQHRPVSPLRRWIGRIFNLLVLLVVLVVVVGGGAVWTGIIEIPGMAEAKNAEERPPSALKGVELLKSPAPPHTLSVPQPVREALGMSRGGKDFVASAKRPDKGMPLVLPASTALDPTRLLRIRARFAPAEVVKIGRVFYPAESKTASRELRSGDRVKRGDVLGVFYSVDVGNKKSDLYDSLIQLKLDEDILERAESARGSVTAIFILNAQRAVVGDRNAVNRAQNNLRAWNISQEDIDEVKAEADRADLDRIKSERNKKTKKEKEQARDEAKKKQLDRWARVELRAPYDSTIVERNGSLHEIVTDPTTNLFILADVDLIAVTAYAPEDDVPLIQALPAGKWKWTVKTVGLEGGLEGTFDEIGYITDQNQHTVPVKGYIPNTGRLLRGGYFATVTIELDPPPDVVEIPMAAVVDDGKQCVVFLQPDPKKPNYTMRRVLVTHRFENTAWVRSKVTKAQQVMTEEDTEQGLLTPEPLKPDDRVILSGVLELKKEVEDREASERIKKKQEADTKAGGS